MLKYSVPSRSHSDKLKGAWQPLRDFVSSLALLGIALLLALNSADAVRRGDGRLGIAYSVGALLLAAITTIVFVPRLARRVKLERWIMPFSFRITAAGAVYILVVFILSAAAANTGNNLLFLIVATLFSTILISGIVARSSLRSLTVSLQVPENVFEGERVYIRVSLRNQKKFFPSYSISIDDLNPKKRSDNKKARTDRASESRDQDAILRHPAYFPVIRAGETRSELVAQVFPHRGRYRLDGFRLATEFPFGLFRRGERVKANGDIIVYPSIHEVSSHFHLLPFMPGRLEGRHVGPGESLYAIREYRQGESARIIDWKSTAKTGKIMAREYAREEESKLCLIVDSILRQPMMGAGAEQFEKAVSLAASLAAHFCEEGAELELVTPDDYVPRGIGRQHLNSVLHCLALVNSRHSAVGGPIEFTRDFSRVLNHEKSEETFSEKVFKIIITSMPRGRFPLSIWRSSHVVYFDEL